MRPARHWHRFTADDCLTALRHAAEDQGVEQLRLEDYRTWRDQHDELVPAASCIVRHLGPWATAVRAAGLTPARPPYGAARRPS